MHLLLRRPGGCIQRAAFGFYRDRSRPSPNDRYYLVLDETRTRLVRHYAYGSQGDMRKALSVLWVDGDMSDWLLNEEGEGAPSWLPEGMEGRELPVALLARCQQLDAAFHFEPEGDICTRADADRLLGITSGFHDGRIERLTRDRDGTLTAAFEGLWGCRVTLRFSGDATCLLPEDEDEWDYWYTASIRMEDGFITLIDDEIEDGEPLPDDPASGFTWFRARRVHYVLEPFPD